MPAMRVCAFIVAVFLAALLSGCGRGSQQLGFEYSRTAADSPSPRAELPWKNAAAPAPDDSSPGLPPLPADSPQDPALLRSRRASIPARTQLLGTELWTVVPWSGSEDQRVVLDPFKNRATLQPQGKDAAWAIWRFDDILPEDLPNLLQIDTGGLLPREYWVGISDYGRMRWQWQGFEPGTGLDSIPLVQADGSALNVISPAGSVYVCIMAFRKYSVSVDRLLLGLDTPAPPPGGLKVVQQPGIAQFLVSWQAPVVACDAVRVERRSSNVNAAVFGVDVAAGSNSLLDFPVSDQNVLLVGPGERIAYRLRTVVAGRAGPPGPWVECWRVPEEPGNLSAGSDKPYLINLQWDPGGFYAFEVYRDAPDNLVQVAGIEGWVDQQVQDHKDHQYWIRGRLDISDNSSDGNPLYYRSQLIGPVSGTRLKAPYIAWVSPDYVESGVSTQFQATVDGIAPYTYTWDFKGATTPDTSTDEQPIVTGGADDSARCHLTVSNAYGSAEYDFDLLVHSGPRPWLQFKYDSANSGQAPYEVSTEGSQKWVYNAGGSIEDGAVVGPDGTVYFGSGQSKLFALNPDGSEKWVLPVSGHILSAPLVTADGSIYASIGNGNALVKVSPGGELLWTNNDGTGRLSYEHPNLRPDGLVYYCGCVVDAGGQTVMSYNNGSGFGGGVAFDPAGRMFTGGGVMHCFTMDGTELWQSEIGTNESTPAVRADGSIVVGSYIGKLFAFDPLGENAWDFDAGFFYSIYGSPAVDQAGGVYFGSYDSFYALNPDGSQRWSIPDTGEIRAGPALDSQGRVVFCRFNQHVICVDSDGQQLWDFPASYSITGCPAIATDGTVYVGTWDGKLYAIGDTP